jgi:hypothetical protein
LLYHLVLVLAGASRGNLQGAQKVILQIHGGLSFRDPISTEKRIAVLVASGGVIWNGIHIETPVIPAKSLP